MAFTCANDGKPAFIVFAREPLCRECFYARPDLGPMPPEPVDVKSGTSPSELAAAAAKTPS